MPSVKYMRQLAPNPGLFIDQLEALMTGPTAWPVLGAEGLLCSSCLGEADGIDDL